MADSPSPLTDRFDISRTTRASAAVEWRTIPPTINVRYKRRPPPLSLLTRRPSDAPAFSPGPLDTATTTSSFTSYPATLSATSGPRSSISQWPLSAAFSTFSETDGAIDYQTANHTLNESTVIDAPEDPVRYLLHHPWDFTEYLHLLAIVQAIRPSRLDSWIQVAVKFNAKSPPAKLHRSVWDCWHRWSVPWNKGDAKARIPGTYPDVPGVQHRCLSGGIRSIIDLYLIVTKILGVADSEPMADYENLAVPRPPASRKRIRHPMYPSPTESPNVPKRTLGDVARRGILPWFHATAINPTVLRTRNITSTLPPHANDERGQNREQEVEEEPVLRLPVHLRNMVIPPPLVRVRGGAG